MSQRATNNGVTWRMSLPSILSTGMARRRWILGILRSGTNHKAPVSDRSLTCCSGLIANCSDWNGTVEGFYDLNDFAVNGIRRALPNAVVGGPEVVGDPPFLDAFLNHTESGHNHATGGTGTPLDFVSFHAKGAPLYINGTAGDHGYVQMNISTQLVQVDQNFAVIQSHPKYNKLPVFVSEMDPDGCAACTSDAYDYRNGLFYAAYSAAAFTRALDLASNRDIDLTGLLTWAFEYEKTSLLLVETGYITGSEYFDGFRVLSTQGIDKAVLNFHRLYAMINGNRVQSRELRPIFPGHGAEGRRPRGKQSDVGAVATFDEKEGKLYVFAWNYHDNHVHFPDAEISVDIESLPSSFAKGGKAKMTHYRVDKEHSNAFPGGWRWVVRSIRHRSRLMSWYSWES